MAAGAGFDEVTALFCALSSSTFLPNFQKSLFRGFAAVSSRVGAAAFAWVDGTEEPLIKGAAESLDSVLGALVLSLTEGSLDDMFVDAGEDTPALTAEEVLPE